MKVGQELYLRWTVPGMQLCIGDRVRILEIFKSGRGARPRARIEHWRGGDSGWVDFDYLQRENTF